MNDPATSNPAPLRACLLGPVDVRLGDRQLIPGPWPRRQSRWLLLLLLATPGYRLPRDQVLEYFWPDMPLSAALNALYKAIHALRRTLEPNLVAGRSSSYVDVQGEMVGLVPVPGLWVDVDRVRWHVARQASGEPHDHLRAALALYRGEFLPDEPYAGWATELRTTLAAERRAIAMRLANLDHRAGSPLRSLDLLEACLAVDPADEQLARAVARNLGAGGQPHSAIHHLERCHAALLEETGEGLDLASESLRQELLDLMTPLHTVIGSDRTSIRHLPARPTPTIGRTAEVHRVRDLLQGESRLVTITGPGGVGKTRLATEIASALSTTAFLAGAFVNFTVIDDTAQFYLPLAAGLDLPAQPAAHLAQVVQAALQRQGPFLLILDNLEHLPGIHEPIATLLQAVPHLTVLATSRSTLRIRAEHVVHLQPLPVPDGRDDRLEAFSQVPAVELFLQCLRAWRGEASAISADEIRTIAQLCRTLDGLPLAIEIAAARSVDQPPATILRQIVARLGELGEGPRDLPPRQRALDATIDWSYRLLNAAGQRAFRVLAVFVGGADDEALRAVLGNDGPYLADVLVAHSLASWQWHGGQRVIVMLETLRQFAFERLVAADERDEAGLAHALHMVRVAEATDPRSGSSGGGTRLERDEPNMQAALAWCLPAGRYDLIVRMTVARGSFWFTHGTPPTTLHAIEMAIQHRPPVDPELWAWAALWGAGLAGEHEDAVMGQRFEHLAREIWTSQGSAVGIARVDHSVAMRHAATNQSAVAVPVFERNLPVFRAAGDIEGVVFSLAGLAQGRRELGESPATAVTLLEEAMVTARQAGIPPMQAYVVVRLLGARLAAGDLDGADSTALQADRLVHLASAWQALPLLALGRATIAVRRGDAPALDRHAWAAYQAATEFGVDHLVWQSEAALLVASIVRGDAGEARAMARHLVRRLAGPDTTRERAVVLPDLAHLAWQLGDRSPEVVRARQSIPAEQFLVVPLPHVPADGSSAAAPGELTPVEIDRLFALVTSRVV